MPKPAAKPLRIRTKISRADLSDSWVASRRVEREMRRLLETLGVSSITPVAVVDRVLTGVRTRCPDWVDQSAWDATAASVSRWATSFGSLSVYDALNDSGKDPESAIKLHTQTLPELRREWMQQQGDT